MGYRSSVAHAGRWLVPSAGDLIFVAFLGLLTCTSLSIRLLGDAGIGWHIRTGQIILATHAIPHADPFSAPSPWTSGHAWFAWEWLYDLGVGWLERVAGLNGVVLFTAVVIAGVFSWTFRMMLRRGTNLVIALILLLLAASAAMIHFQARPHVVSWLFTVVWFWILDVTEPAACDHPASGRWRLWLLPLLMFLWVNVHGGFLIGLALLAIYWFAARWRLARLRLPHAEERFDCFLQKIRCARRFRELTVVGVISALATLANPYGIKLHIHIYRYLTNRFLMDHIDEFQSPNFHYVAQKCFAGLLLLTLVALAIKSRELIQTNLAQFLVVIFAVYAGLYASRNLPVSSLLLVLIVGPWLSAAMGRLAGQRGFVQRRARAFQQFFERMKSIELSLVGHLWPALAVVFICSIAAHSGRFGSQIFMNAHFDPKRFPVSAVDFVEKRHIRGPIMSVDYWGGYLIYRLYPETRAVIDDRHDFYGEEFLKSYLKMVHVEPGWQEFLEQHESPCVLVPANSALANILGETSGWGAVYRDDVGAVFVPAWANAK